MEQFTILALQFVERFYNEDENFRNIVISCGFKSYVANLQLPYRQRLLFALFYRLLGWSIIPIRAGTKQSLVKWKEYQTRLPDFEEVFDWFTYYCWPHVGCGLVLGPVSNVFAVDVDGSDAHNVLTNKVSLPSGVLRSVSGSRVPNRYHLFFRDPGCRTNAMYTPWHSKLEFRGQSGIVVLPPAWHKSGNRYEWDCEHELLLNPLQPVPKAIYDALLAKGKRVYQKPTIQIPDQAVEWEGMQLTLSTKLSKQTRRFLLGIYAFEDRWNTRLFNAACDLCGCGVPEKIALVALLQGAKPITSSDQDAAVRTIESAYGEQRLPGLDYRD